MEKKLLGQYLLEQKLISPQQLEMALEVQANRIDGGHMPLIGTILTEMGAIKVHDLTFAIEQQERDRMRVTA